MERILCGVGILAILLITFLWSTNKRNINYRTISLGLALQIALAALFVLFPLGLAVFNALGDIVTSFLSYANSGAVFLFGNIAKTESVSVFGFQFALTIVPIIVFFSAIVSVLYHFGIIQRVVQAMAWVMQKVMGTSAVESLSTAAEVFLGQTEAPLLVRHYIPHTSNSELFAMMVGGFATIAGSTMGAYIAMGIPASYLMVASILAAPGGLVLAKLAMPQEGSVATRETLAAIDIEKHGNTIDALSRGALDGFKISVNVIVVLLAFKSVVALLDALLGWGSLQMSGFGVDGIPTSIDAVLGWLFTPFAWMVGITGEEAKAFAMLLGTKISQTEFIAFDKLSVLIQSGAISERTATMATVALCGFANVMSIGIQIGGYGIMAPNRRADVARLGFKAMCIGALANLLTACVVGLFI